MKTGKNREITICPNCGTKTSMKDYLQMVLPEIASMGSTIECPNCGYDGLPISVREQDYPKITFPNRRF